MDELYQQAIDQGLRLYSTTEAAEYLCRDIRTIQGYIQRGKLPAIKYRGRWYLTKYAMDKFQDEHLARQMYTAADVFGDE